MTQLLVQTWSQCPVGSVCIFIWFVLCEARQVIENEMFPLKSLSFVPKGTQVKWKSIGWVHIFDILETEGKY